MTIETTANQITNQTAQYAPLVIAGVHAAQQSTASGADKKQAVLDAVLGAVHVGEQIPVPSVAAVSTMIDVVVSIFNSLGIFHRKPAQSPAAPPAQ